MDGSRFTAIKYLLYYQSNMDTKEYEKLYKIENNYWWHVGRKYVIEERLQKIKLPNNAKILNVGCGTGGNVPILNKFGEVFNVDESKIALDFLQKTGAKNIIQVSGTCLPFEDESFDMVVGFDVIEHIKDDKSAIKEWNRVLRPSGFIFVTAPAYQWLWSGHDLALQHYRRYSINELSKLFNGFKVTKKSYMIVSTFFAVAGYRFIKKIFPDKNSTTSYVNIPNTVNKILIGLLRIESKLLNYTNAPFGTSVFIIAQKDSQ